MHGCFGNQLPANEWEWCGAGGCRFRAASVTSVLKAALAGLAIFLLPGFGHAQNSPPPGTEGEVRPDSTYLIEKVEVVGRRNVEVIPSQVLDGKMLQKLSSHSVADAIRYFSGAQIKDYGGIGGLKTVNIRSLGSQHVGVFFDGIQVGNAQNGVVDLGRFSLDNIEVISLYNGQKSAIFQSAKDFASAGSIYMETRRPVFDTLKRNNWRVALKGGSFKTINPSLLWEHKFGDKLSASFNAEYMYTSGEYRFRYAKKDGYDTAEVRKNGDVRVFRAEAALFGRLNRGEWKAKAYFYDSERGYPGASVRTEPGKFVHQDRQWDTDFLVQGSLRKQFSPFYSLLVNGKYSHDYLHYISDPRLDVTTMHVDNEYLQQEVFLSAANLFSITRWWTANLSVDGQWNKLNADMLDFVYPHRYTILGAAATSLRFDRFIFQASLLYTCVNDHIRTKESGPARKNKFTPAAMASYKLLRNHDFHIRAFYKRIFRMPTFNDLYYTFIGSSTLRPEYTNQYNVGLAYAKDWKQGFLRRLETQADVYYNEVDDKIVAMPGLDQFHWIMINLGYVEIRGVDAMVKGDFKCGELDLTSRLSYTYQRAQDFTDPTSDYYGGQIPYIPWHAATAITGASFRKWDLNYSFIYTGKRYERSANIPENHVVPWYTHDLSLARTIPLGKNILRITAEVNNIFNQPYEVVENYPMPGTNFRIILNLTL